MGTHRGMTAHESLQREAEVEGSSNRSFGWVFTVVFVILAFLPVLSGSGSGVIDIVLTRHRQMHFNLLRAIGQHKVAEQW